MPVAPGVARCLSAALDVRLPAFCVAGLAPRSRAFSFSRTMTTLASASLPKAVHASAGPSAVAKPPASDWHVPAPLLELLRSARDVIEAAKPVVTVVMGNEAGDLDSISAAIAYSYLLSSEGVSAVPLMSFPRADLTLRNEATCLLRELAIPVERLLFEGDVDLLALHATQRLRLVLVDHNRPRQTLETLELAVAEVIDHHDDAKRCPNATKRVIEPAGSCCTLVAREITNRKPELLASAALQRLLLAPILLDTSCLDGTKGRCTDDDKMFSALLLAGAGPGGLAAFFSRLIAEKSDQGRLSVNDLLRRDYKEWAFGPAGGPATKVGIASIGVSLESLSGKDRLWPEILAFSAGRGLDRLLVMTGFVDATKAFHRQLMIVDAEKGAPLAAFLTSSPLLALEPLEIPGLTADKQAVCFEQRNVASTRKQIQPLVAQFFGGQPA